MTERSRKLLLLTASGCVMLSLLSLGTLSCANLQVIAIWIVIMLNKDQTNKEIFRLKSEIWALKARNR